MSRQAQVAVAEPEIEISRKVKPKEREQTRKQPRYRVVLWDDDDHSYDYVIRMMRALFSHTPERAYEIACEVDSFGRAVCLTTTKEHAELKRDQVHAYGRDAMISRCQGSMYCTIEAVD